MPAKTKNSKGSKPTVSITNEVGNYEKHPFFIKKAEAAKILLREVGLPKQLAKVRR